MTDRYAVALAEIRSERARLAEQLTKLDQVIRTLQELDGSPVAPSGGITFSAGMVPQPPAASGVLTLNGGTTSKSSKRSLRAIVSQLVSAEPQGLTARQIADLLIDQGDTRVKKDSPDTTSPVRTALKTAADAGEIRRGPDGAWYPPSPDPILKALADSYAGDGDHRGEAKS